MIEQYLLNTNESATVSILQKKLELNKALICATLWCVDRTVARRRQLAAFVNGGDGARRPVGLGRRCLCLACTRCAARTAARHHVLATAS